MLARAAFGLLLLAANVLGQEYVNNRVAAVDAFDREIPRNRDLVLQGVVKGGYDHPEVILIAPGGETYLARDLERAGADFTFNVEFTEGRGRYRLEVMVRRGRNYKSALRTDVWYGVVRPRDYKPEPVPKGPRTPAGLHAQVLGQRFRALVNEERRRLKMKPVGWNPAVAARAQEHAELMARAKRRLHSFPPFGSVLDRLIRDGAGDHPWAGENKGWRNVDAGRPFHPPVKKPPGPETRIHVVPYVIASTSLEEMFERYFVREPAFRLLVVDRHCLEVAVGAARTPPPARTHEPTGRTSARLPGALVYYCVTFVQINDRSLLRRQEKTFRELVREVKNAPLPATVRNAAAWARPEPLRPLLAKLEQDGAPEMRAAVWDARLVLDEAAARRTLDAHFAEAESLRTQRRYGDLSRHLAPLFHLQYDLDLYNKAYRLERQAAGDASAELGEIRKLDGEERMKREQDLLTRMIGHPDEDKIRKRIG